MERTKQFEKSPESEVRNAIEAFEQILEAMPGDRTALETLFDAYDHIGDRRRALDHLLQLATIIVEEGDTDSVIWIYDGLVRIGEGNSKANQVIAQLETLMLNMGLPSPSETVVSRGAHQQGADVSAELALAWTLRQANELSQDEYSAIVQDLTENSTKHVEVPVSVQHAIFDRNYSCTEKVLAHMSTDSHCPVIHLSMFEFDRVKFKALPGEFATVRGAVVFEQVGGDYLVAVLNPYDEKLRQEVTRILNNRCHFYVTGAQDYDSFLMRVRQPAPV